MQCKARTSLLADQIRIVSRLGNCCKDVIVFLFSKALRNPRSARKLYLLCERVYVVRWPVWRGPEIEMRDVSWVWLCAILAFYVCSLLRRFFCGKFKVTLWIIDIGSLRGNKSQAHFPQAYKWSEWILKNIWGKKRQISLPVISIDLSFPSFPIPDKWSAMLCSGVLCIRTSHLVLTMLISR